MVAVPAAYDPLAVCVACSVTMPAPVTVTLCPETVAGPLSTEYVMAPNEGDVAVTAKGNSPTVWSAIGLKVRWGSPGETLKLVVVVAAAKFPVAACFAVTVTLPLPPSVTVEPDTLALPALIEYTIGAGDNDVALTVNGASPNV